MAVSTKTIAAASTRVSTGQVLRSLGIPLLAVVSALVLGAIVIWITTGDSGKIVQAYTGLIKGAFLKQRGFTETLVAATPYIFAGLAVVVGFKGGLFNIGAEGQFYIGAVCSAYVGYAVTGLPIWIHLPLTLLAAVAGGAIWGAIPGFLKARFGSHEVINTIMMNYVAILLVDYLVTGPLKQTRSAIPKTRDVLPSAQLPNLLPPPDRLHAGLLLGIALAFGVWWLLYKTTWGFQIRTVGANPNAARYAGMNVTRTIVLTMALSGALAALAGASEVIGLNRNLPQSFSSGYGFDSIAVALLARNNPLAVIPSALLFGALRNGADTMELESQVSRYISQVIQALVLLFVAVPAIVRYIYHIRATRSEQEAAPLTRGWGG